MKDIVGRLRDGLSSGPNIEEAASAIERMQAEIELLVRERDELKVKLLLEWGHLTVTPRMDGDPLERAHWRNVALREALSEIAATDAAASPEAPRAIAKNALHVDEWNAERGFAPGPSEPPAPPAPRVA